MKVLKYLYSFRRTHFPPEAGTILHTTLCAAAVGAYGAVLPQLNLNNLAQYYILSRSHLYPSVFRLPNLFAKH